VSVGVQYALSSVPSYTGFLKDMGWVIGQMVTMLVIKDLVDTQFPGVINGPSITAIYGMGQAVTPGLPMSILASGFGDQPGECSVIFLTPALSKTIVDGIKLAAGGIPKLKDLKSKSAWEAAKAIKSAIGQVKAAGALLTGGIPTMLENGIVLMPTQPGSNFTDMGKIELGVVPKKANCGWVPQPGVLVPFCTFSGGGKSFSLLVIGKKC